MNRYSIDSPDDLDEPFDYSAAAEEADRENDSRPVRIPKMTAADVDRIRNALYKLGLPTELVEQQILSACGAEWVRTGFLFRRQAV